MEFRNLLSTIFGNNKPPINLENAQLINSFNSLITNYNSEIYNDLTVRSCVDTIARHVSKLKPVHIIKDEDGRHLQSTTINSLLNSRPNIYMSTADFLYKVTSQLLYYGNAFIFLQKDKQNNIIGFYPIDFATCELKEVNNALYLKFNFYTGKTIAVPYTDIIHIRHLI